MAVRGVTITRRHGLLGSARMTTESGKDNVRSKMSENIRQLLHGHLLERFGWRSCIYMKSFKYFDSVHTAGDKLFWLGKKNVTGQSLFGKVNVLPTTTQEGYPDDNFSRFGPGDKPDVRDAAAA